MKAFKEIASRELSKETNDITCAELKITKSGFYR